MFAVPKNPVLGAFFRQESDYVEADRPFIVCFKTRTVKRDSLRLVNGPSVNHCVVKYTFSQTRINLKASNVLSVHIS